MVNTQNNPTTPQTNSNQPSSTPDQESTNTLNTRVNIGEIGQQKNQETVKAMSGAVEQLKQAGAGITEALNKVRGFATVHLDRETFDSDARKQVREDAMQGFGRNIEGFKQNAVDAAKFVGNGIKDMAGAAAGAVNEKVISPAFQKLNEARKAVVGAFDSLKESFKLSKSTERKEMVQNFINKEIDKEMKVVGKIENDALGDKAKDLAQATRQAAVETFDKMQNKADTENNGIVTREMRLEAKAEIKDQIKELRSGIREIRAEEMLEQRISKYEEKLEKSGLSDDAKNEVRKGFDDYRKKLETRIEERRNNGGLNDGDVLKARTDSDMEKDLDRRSNVLSRIEKLESAATAIGDTDITLKTEGLKEKFGEFVSDQQFTREEKNKMDKILDDIRNDVLKGQLQSGISGAAQKAVEKLNEVASAKPEGESLTPEEKQKRKEEYANQALEQFKG